jgi:hypothetical protein
VQQKQAYYVHGAFVRNFLPLPMSYKAVAVILENTMKLANFVPSEETESDALPPDAGSGGGEGRGRRRVLHQCVEKERRSIPQFDLISAITVEN